MVWCLCCHIYIFLSISSCKDFLWLFVFYLAYLFCLSVIFFVGSFWVRARPFRHALRVVCKGSLRGPIPEAFSIVTFGTSSSRNHPPFCHVPPSLAFVHPTEVRSWSAEAVASQVGFYCRPCVQRRPFLLRSAGWPLGRLCFEVLCENWKSSQAVHLLKTNHDLPNLPKYQMTHYSNIAGVMFSQHLRASLLVGTWRNLLTFKKQLDRHERWAQGPWKGFPLRKGMQLTVSAKVFLWNGEIFFLAKVLAKVYVHMSHV